MISRLFTREPEPPEPEPPSPCVRCGSERTRDIVAGADPVPYITCPECATSVREDLDVRPPVRRGITRRGTCQRCQRSRWVTFYTNWLCDDCRAKG